MQSSLDYLLDHLAGDLFEQSDRKGNMPNQHGDRGFDHTFHAMISNNNTLVLIVLICVLGLSGLLLGITLID